LGETEELGDVLLGISSLATAGGASAFSTALSSGATGAAAGGRAASTGVARADAISGLRSAAEGLAAVVKSGDFADELVDKVRRSVSSGSSDLFRFWGSPGDLGM
jgi:hypothetical protein